MSEGGSTRSKVARLISEYGLEGLGDELVERWTRTENRHGLRRLADEFNQELLRAALEEAPSQAAPLEGEVENLYRLLTDEEVSSGVHTQTRNRLDQVGVDVSQLESDFVSYQAIYTYFTNYRSVTPPNESPSEQEHVDGKLNTIQRLRTRLENVTERSLTELVNANHLTLGNFDVLVTIRIHCSDCDTRFPITDLLTNGGCDCSRE